MDNYTEPEHDLFRLDFDGDGIDDFVISAGHLDAYGIPHDINFKLDLDGDGRADASLDLTSSPDEIFPNSLDLRLDVFHHGQADAELRLSDVHHTGVPDRADLKLDFDGDGTVDFAVAGVDAFGHGIPDLPLPESIADALWGDVDTADHHSFGDHDAFMPLMETHDDLAFHDFQDLWEIHGTPVEDMALWDQQVDPNSCAIATTNMLFRSIGLDIGEPAIAQAFEEYGIYDPLSGTDPELIDVVINDIASHTGLPVHAAEVHGFTEQDLIDMVDHGVRPLVGIDPTDLYADHTSLSTMIDHYFGIPDAGHAVQVTAIIRSPGGDLVVLNDPGLPVGAGVEIPLNRFMEAASPFGFEAVILTATA